MNYSFNITSKGEIILAIPSQREIRLPLLELCKDEKEHTIPEAEESLSQFFSLTDKERNEWLPSGNAKRFKNRIRWAKHALNKAGLIEITRRGYFKITSIGIDILSRGVDEISNDLINRLKIESTGDDDTPQMTSEVDSEHTPEELIERSLQAINDELKEELLMQVKNCSSDFFERLVIDLLLKMGFGKASGNKGLVVGGSGDKGIDGIIYQDKLGFDKIYIQAKKWVDATVGRPKIQEFVGALSGVQA